MTTHAYGAHAADKPIEAIAIERRAPGPRDVQVDIAFCGICHSDLHTVRSEWPGTRYPCVPGHEIVGHVSAVGSAVDTFKVGDTVGVGCLVGSCQHCAACDEGLEQFCANGFVGTYNSPEEAVANARRLVEAGAKAVKLEGGASHVAQIEAIVRAGIPLMAHIGMLPQNVRLEGGYKVKGRGPAETERLVADARAVEAAGAFSAVLEIVAADAARQITEAISIPTIGIGSGEHCDGQILVTNDLIGLYPWFTPKFVSPEAHVAEEIRRAARIFIERTRSSVR